MPPGRQALAMREGCGQRPGREDRPPAVTCEDLGRDRYKRIIARCTVAGEGLEKWMVVNGWALAERPVFPAGMEAFHPWQGEGAR